MAAAEAVVEPVVEAAIRAHPSSDVRQVAREVSAQLARFVPPSLVLRVRGSLSAARNVAQAREEASTSLGAKLEVADEVAAKLLAIFKDELRPMKERLEAAKELRHYLKLGLDAGGIGDGDTLFVIESEWLAGIA